MWAVESADGKWRRRSLEDRGEKSRDTAFAIRPRDMTCWPLVGREVREEKADAIQAQVDRHVRATLWETRMLNSRTVEAANPYRRKVLFSRLQRLSLSNFADSLPSFVCTGRHRFQDFLCAFGRPSHRL